MPDEARRQRGRRLALALTGARLALAPVLPLVALTRAPGVVLALLLVVGFVTDLFDGVVARRHGVADGALRLADTVADNAFYIGAAIAAWMRHADAFTDDRIGIAAVLGTKLLDHAVELQRYGRLASYHLRSSRLWGLLLFLALVTLFAGGPHWPLGVALAAGTLSQLESLLVTLLLPRWRHDVPSVGAALRLRASGGES